MSLSIRVLLALLKDGAGGMGSSRMPAPKPWVQTQEPLKNKIKRWGTTLTMTPKENYDFGYGVNVNYSIITNALLWWGMLVQRETICVGAGGCGNVLLQT